MKLMVAAILGVLTYIPAWAGPVNAAENLTQLSDARSGASSEPGAKQLDDAVINPKSTALVVFRADWCGPCRTMAPHLVSAARSLNIQIVEIDASANPALAESYKIENIPTLLLFSKGVLVDRKVGNMPETEIAAWLKKAVGAG